MAADALAAELDEMALRARAAEEDRRADEAWRALQETARQRNEAAEEAALAELRAAARPRPYRTTPPPSSGSGASSSDAPLPPPQRDDDEPDAHGWTPIEQRALEAAMRTNRASSFESKGARWQAIAAQVPGHSAKECVARCRAVGAAVRSHLAPPLLRLDFDGLLTVLGSLGGKELCTLACVSKELLHAAHDDALWLPLADALPSKWAYSRRDRVGEAPWTYTLRIREGLYGAWRKLNEHRGGQMPYLRELGWIERGRFVPHDGKLDYKMYYGAVCELVQLEAARQDGLSHRVYKAVAEELVQRSSNPRSAVPPDLHMTVREIYKTCYPGFGAGTGSGAYAPGLQAGGSSTKASTTGQMLGKGVATMTKKVQDEDLRKRLE